MQIIEDVEQDSEWRYRYVLQLTNMYRLFGHDTELTDILTGEVITPFADVKSCVIEPGSLQWRPTTHYNFRPSFTFKRNGRSYVLPPLNEEKTQPDFSLGITPPKISLCCYKQWRVKAAPRLVLSKTPTPVTFTVRAAFKGDPKHFEMVGKRKQRPDFHRDKTLVAPRNPMGSQTAQPVITENPSLDADAAVQ
jgi:hypothetical protein